MPQSGVRGSAQPQRNVPDQQRLDFHKWLRYYLDFCSKYDSDPMLNKSFAWFDEKLQSKGQSETQRQQARRAITIYYRMVGAIKSPSTPAGDSSPRHPLASTRLSTPSPVSSNQTGLPSAIPEKSVSSVADEPLKLTGPIGKRFTSNYRPPSGYAIIRIRLGKLTATGCSSFKLIPKVKMLAYWIACPAGRSNKRKAR
jgi:hypothetical protein